MTCAIFSPSLFPVLVPEQNCISDTPIVHELFLILLLIRGTFRDQDVLVFVPDSVYVCDFQHLIKNIF